MILGVAQVVVNVADLDPERDALLAAGYEESFAQRGIPNHPAKRELQAAPREQLDMVHLAGPAGGTAVELTAYAGAAPAGRPAFGLELPVPAGERTRVTVASADPEPSRAFWRDVLGFREIDEELLAFPAIRTEWALEVALRAGAPPAGPTSVDAAGCVLVTLLSTGLEADLARIAGDVLVLRSTPSWEEPIDGRVLRVAMAEGPSGELIEMIELPRQT